MPIDDIFAFATRNKLRFASPRGDLTTEQLWDVPLRSANDFNLDYIAREANTILKSATEESFVTTRKTTTHKRLEATLEIVKAVIAAKLADEDTAKKRATNKTEKEQLLKILAEKQQGKLSALTEKELQDRIAALEE